jgi:hypothetical protein
MTFGTVPNGTVNLVAVSATVGGTYSPVGALQGWEYGGEAQTTTEEFYNSFPSIITVGEPTNDGNYSGKWADGDTALALLLAAYKDKTVIFGKFAPNGTDGEILPMRVSRFRLTGSGVRQAANYQFSVVQSDAPVDAGTGL